MGVLFGRRNKDPGPRLWSTQGQISVRVSSNVFFMWPRAIVIGIGVLDRLPSGVVRESVFKHSSFNNSSSVKQIELMTHLGLGFCCALLVVVEG